MSTINTKKVNDMDNLIVEVFIKPVSEKLIEFINKNQYWTAVIYAIFAGLPFLVFGYIVHYLLTLKRSKLEMKTIEIEHNAKFRLEEIELNRTIESIHSQLESLLFEVREYGEIKDKEKNYSIEKKFYNLSRDINLKLVPLFANYIRLCFILRKNEQIKIRFFVSNQIESFILVLVSLYESLNDKDIKKYFEASFEIDFIPMKMIVNYAESMYGFFSFEEKKKFKELKTKLAKIELEEK